MTIAGSLAQLLTRTSFEDLPLVAVDHAAMLISSTIASAASGSGLSSSRIVRTLVEEQSGVPESSIWFHIGPKLPVANAARVNALMSDAAASDDSDLRNIVHHGAALAATSLALGERMGASGKEVLAAVVLGYEIAGRIGAAMMPAYKVQGFHGCIVTVFGAAVAAGQLLNLDEKQMAQTIAIASSSIGGLKAAAKTTEAHEYFAGNSAMLGINAALAAQRGLVAEEDVLEVEKGFFAVYGGKDIESVLRDWDKEWDIVTDMGIKLAPGAHPFHAVAEAAVTAAREGNVSADEVEAIIMAKPADGTMAIWPLGGPIHPKDFLGAARSSTYFAAAGVADKDFSWIHASKEKICDPVIHQLIDKIRVGEPLTQNVERFRQGASVTIKTKDGRSYTSTVYAPKGSGPRGIHWADVDQKYRTLVPMAKLSPQRIEDSIQTLHELRSVKDVSELTQLLH